MTTIEGSFVVLSVILTRMIILLVMVIIMFYKWQKLETQYLDDMKFLFGLFFLGLVFGKAIDLLYNLTWFDLNTVTLLNIVKVRFILVFFYLSPLFYGLLEILLVWMAGRKEEKKKNTKLNKDSYRKKLRSTLTLYIIAIEFFIIIIAPNSTIIGILLPCMVIPTLFLCVLLFYLAHRLQKLSEIKPLVVMIGFLTYLISNITRPSLQNILGETPLYILISEIFDLINFFVIFAGLL